MIPENGVFIIEENGELYRLSFMKPYPHAIEFRHGCQWEELEKTDAEIESIYLSAHYTDVYPRRNQ